MELHAVSSYPPLVVLKKNLRRWYVGFVAHGVTLTGPVETGSAVGHTRSQATSR